MGRPYGLLRCGFGYDRTLGMRRITNYPVHIALGQEERIYVLCRSEGAALIRRYSLNEEDFGIIGAYGKEDGQFMWPVAIIADADENLYVSDEYLNQITIFDKEGEPILPPSTRSMSTTARPSSPWNTSTARPWRRKSSSAR